VSVNLAPPPLRARSLVETLHGVEVRDPFRWLEPGDDPDVRAWQEGWTAIARARLSALPQRARLEARLRELWRYDDQTPDSPCLLSSRRWYATRGREQDKWALWLREGEGLEGRLVLDPNAWARTETLGGSWSSPDGRYLAYGVAKGGDENPVVRVLDLRTMEHLPDRLRGWKQGMLSWRHDNAGFYYSSKPSPGELAPGEEHYWHRVWYHPLGTDGSEDTLIFHDPQVRERYHVGTVSEDGNWLLLQRSEFHKNAIFLLDLWGGGGLIPAAPELDADHQPTLVDDRMLVMTDQGASRYRVMVARLSSPRQSTWTELIPEHPTDTLSQLAAVGGRLYAVYQHAAISRIAVHDLDGRWLHDVALPGLGTASVSGFWRRPEVRISYQSFTVPPTEFLYDPEARTLSELHRSPIDVDTTGMVTEQAWTTSPDGTRVPMFLVYRSELQKNADNPVFLTGYGGFNISRMPVFSTLYALWVAEGGVIALPNLRGGGEFGAAWHEAGMRERKQNVFDDFLAAAQWLVDERITRPERLAIAGGSNGGLLVAAAMVQRPELFRAVLCQVPLADMLRFHLFGIAAIWAQEYGSPDDPAMFPFLRAYSPYHNVPEGLRAPAVLITASQNDARTDPVHARKLFARLIQATHRRPDHAQPILLVVAGDSGHLGAAALEDQIQQSADNLAFLMDQLGMG